jgi:hypothetical protein
MKNFYLDFSMNKEDGKTVQFIDELEEFEESFTMSTEEGNYCPIIEEPIANIFVDSTGGENRMVVMLYEFFKNSKYQYQFTIIGDFSSNAILLLLALNPKYIKIMRQSNTIVHLSNYNHPVSNIILNDPKHNSLNEFNDFRTYLEILFELYKMFLTKDELKEIKKGKDVYLPSIRVNKLFNELKKNKKIQIKSKKIFELTL